MIRIQRAQVEKRAIKKRSTLKFVRKSWLVIRLTRLRTLTTRQKTVRRSRLINRYPLTYPHLQKIYRTITIGFTRRLLSSNIYCSAHNSSRCNNKRNLMRLNINPQPCSHRRWLMQLLGTKLYHRLKAQVFSLLKRRYKKAKDVISSKFKSKLIKVRSQNIMTHSKARQRTSTKMRFSELKSLSNR